MTPLDIDPQQGWYTSSAAALMARLRGRGPQTGLTIIGVDGPSGSGKSTVARALAATDRHIAVVHTDDIAWHQSFFDWDSLLAEHILCPLQDQGPPLTYRPPAWAEHNRTGAISIPAGAAVVIVEGVGACRRDLDAWFDATIWVHADPVQAWDRTVARGVDTVEFIADWMTQENALFGRDQPWKRSDMIVLGTPDQPTPPAHLVVATGPRHRAHR